MYMIIIVVLCFLEWDNPPEYVNWKNCPKYKIFTLSELLENHENLLDGETHAPSTGRY